MNKISIVFAFLLISNIVFAQKKKNQAPTAKDISPPNCIWVEKDDMSFWIDQTEVANIHWVEFLEDIKKNNPEMYESMLPDTTVWEGYLPTKWKDNINHQTDIDTFFNHKGDTMLVEKNNHSYLINYFKHRGFRFYPVVGISYEQASAYCKWRSKMVTQNFNSNKQTKKLKNYQIEINYRLPTTEEWELVAQGNTHDKYGFEIVDKKQQRKFKRFYSESYRRANTLRGINDYFIMFNITEYIYAYPSNEFGLYNMIGNVAEMVQEKGIAKGGSWLDELENCKIKNHKIYTQPNAWLGFRCVCEVKIKKIEQL